MKPSTPFEVRFGLWYASRGSEKRSEGAGLTVGRHDLSYLALTVGRLDLSYLASAVPRALRLCPNSSSNRTNVTHASDVQTRTSV
jgi:hypothetical protein